MAAAAPRVTPVTLELGGKDAFVVCGDADLGQVVPIAVKAAFLNCGQNCASGERYIVESCVYDAFCQQVAAVANSMRQGPALGHGGWLGRRGRGSVGVGVGWWGGALEESGMAGWVCFMCAT